MHQTDTMQALCWNARAFAVRHQPSSWKQSIQLAHRPRIACFSADFTWRKLGGVSHSRIRLAELFRQVFRRTKIRRRIRLTEPAWGLSGPSNNEIASSERRNWDKHFCFLFWNLARSKHTRPAQYMLSVNLQSYSVQPPWRAEWCIVSTDALDGYANNVIAWMLAASGGTCC